MTTGSSVLGQIGFERRCAGVCKRKPAAPLLEQHTQRRVERTVDGLSAQDPSSAGDQDDRRQRSAPAAYRRRNASIDAAQLAARVSAIARSEGAPPPTPMAMPLASASGKQRRGMHHARLTVQTAGQLNSGENREMPARRSQKLQGGGVSELKNLRPSRPGHRLRTCRTCRLSRPDHASIVRYRCYVALTDA